MNCKQAQALIRTLPCSEWSTHERRELDEHVDACADCAQLLRAEQRLETAMQTLFEPQPPNTIVPVVMARIRSQPRYHSPAPSRARSTLSTVSRWLGLAAAIGAYAFSFVQGAGPSFPQLDTARQALLMPSAIDASTMVFAAGLLLYVAGLFAPWSRSPRE